MCHVTQARNQIGQVTTVIVVPIPCSIYSMCHITQGRNQIGQVTTRYSYAYNVLHTCLRVERLLSSLQTGDSEQFEQVVFRVWPMRAALRVYQVARWIREHPVHITIATVAIVTIPVLSVFAMPKFVHK